MDTTLILIGVGCIIGAIIGGGVKLVQIELSQVTSLWRQSLLGLFGVILVFSGLVAGGHLSLGGGQAPAAAEADKPRDDASPPVGGPPVNTVEPAAPLQAEPEPTKPKPKPKPKPESMPGVMTEPEPAPPATTLPGKVDIFWCVTDDGGDGNRTLGDRIAPALRETGRIGRVRVRPLQQATNARPDYGITGNIVRFDPGEHPAADALARIASDASGAGFAAAPALPGTPSIDYLSIFVCAAH